MDPVRRHGDGCGFAAALLLSALLLPAAALATSLVHLDTRALTLESPEIVIGEVERVRSYWNASRTKILTDVEVRVTRALKGGAADRLTLTQLGGVVDGARYTVPGCPVFEPGEEALLFVWRDPAGRAQVNGLAQGKFDIRRDRASGERFVQRAIPGFGVRDLKTLRAVPAGQPLPRLPLDDLVREITRTLALEDQR
jgi:hypothetical protein